ncbi:hypothetical protein K438DRAFT_1983741 [Mycena galopus ATCC 62051]|nr:hypothetical protein K438DRAFT_1983741 [Mycena galopus ATCC 62051]
MATLPGPLPLWKWRSAEWYEDHRAFLNPRHSREGEFYVVPSLPAFFNLVLGLFLQIFGGVVNAVRDAEMEQAQIRLWWARRDSKDHAARAFAVGHLAACAGIAFIRVAAQDPDRFERWLWDHATNHHEFVWGGGAGWGTTRSNTAPPHWIRSSSTWILNPRSPPSPTPVTDPSWGTLEWGSGGWGEAPLATPSVEVVETNWHGWDKHI